jgi:hypothetical protein
MQRLDISLNEIDLQDERFRISYHYDLEKFLISIKKVGLINPLLIVKRDSPTYVVVSGWKRLSACLELALTNVPAFLIEQEDDFRIFLLCLYENWTIRKFNVLEKAEILIRLSGFIKDEKKIVAQFFPLLDIPSNLSYFDLYHEIARLDPDWKEIIFKKNIPLSSIRFLTEMIPEDRDSLIPLILPLNVNKIKSFIEDLYELSKITGSSPRILLSTPEFQSVHRSDSLSSLQKAERIRSMIREQRYPNLSSWKKSFQASIKRARLSKDVAFDSSSFFEDGEFNVTFDIKDKEAFQKRISNLLELINDEDFFSVFNRSSDG